MRIKTRGSFVRIATIACLFLLITACATGIAGRSQFLLFSEESAIASSKQAYTQLLTPLAEGGKINTDRKLKARVNKITGRIVAQAVLLRPETKSWDWEIKIIDDAEMVNAWAMAGGKMALYTGLVQKIKPTDDELAQVIGHEISHALAKHSAEKMSIATVSQVGVMAVGIATDQDAVTMTGATLAAAMVITLPNSRTMESEADRIGIELAAKAGYNPKAAATLWNKMGKLGGDKPPQLLSTHPNPASREKTLKALAPEMMPYYLTKNSRPTFPVK